MKPNQRFKPTKNACGVFLWLNLSDMRALSMWFATALALCIQGHAFAATDLSVVGNSAAEGNSNTPFALSISRSSDLTNAINVGVYTSAVGYEPASADDYSGLAQRTRLVLPAAQSSLDIYLPLLGDTTPEADETFALNISKAFEVPAAAAFYTAADFSVKLGSSTAPTSAEDVVLADLDGDGMDDLIAASASNYFAVRRNTSSQGTLSFAANATFSAGTIYGSECVVAVDFDSDGKPDVAVPSGSSVAVRRNTSTIGSVSFAGQQLFPAGDTPTCLAAGDLDADGKIDLVVTNYQGSNVTVLRNTSVSGGIDFARMDFAAGPSPYGVAIADLDGDGKADVMVSGRLTDKVTILKNAYNGTSLLFTTQTLTVGQGPQLLDVGDIDGDGKLDLVVPIGPAHTISLYRNLSVAGTITFDAPAALTTSNAPAEVAIGDVDGDGRKDLAVADNSVVSVFRNIGGPGTLNFAARQDFSTAGQPVDIVIGDLDENGSPDLGAACRGAGVVSVLQAVTTPVTITTSQGVATILDDDGGDGTPNAFAFADQTDTPLNSVRESDVVTISGINYPVRVSVIGGEYRINGGAYTSVATRMNNGDTVQVRHTSAASDNSASSTTLSVGGVVDNFTSTTGDATPNNFTFTDQSGVAPAALVISNVITVGGITVPSAISVTGGSYSIGCTGMFTTSPSTINNGQTVCARHTASMAYSTATNTVLNIGGVPDTFTSITQSAPPPSGGGGGGSVGWSTLIVLILSWLGNLFRRVDPDAPGTFKPAPPVLREALKWRRTSNAPLISIAIRGQDLQSGGMIGGTF